jgi:hypothetical protein
MEDLHGNVGDLVEEMGRQDVENRNAIAASGRGVGAQCAGFACGNQGSGFYVALRKGPHAKERPDRVGRSSGRRASAFLYPSP